MTFDKCQFGSCKCRAHYGPLCGRHASKCNHKTGDNKSCKKACEPGKTLCSLHENEFTTCSICYNEIHTKRMIKFSSCTHSFCKSCVRNWIQAQANKNCYPRCPMCRTPIDIEPNTTNNLIKYIHHKLKLCNSINNKYEKVRIFDSIFITLSKPIGMAFLNTNKTFKQTIFNKIYEYKITYPDDAIMLSYHESWCKLFVNNN